jgi:hypothetical protein
MRSPLDTQYLEIRSNLLQALPAENKISLTLDIWTSPNTLASLGVIGSFITSDWQYKEVLLGFEPLSGTHDGNFDIEPTWLTCFGSA